MTELGYVEIGYIDMTQDAPEKPQEPISGPRKSAGLLEVEAMMEGLTEPFSAPADAPCLMHEETMHWWSGNSDLLRASAALQCLKCPVQEACLEYATQARECWGVWGGKDFSLENEKRMCKNGHYDQRKRGDCLVCDRERKTPQKEKK